MLVFLFKKKHKQKAGTRSTSTLEIDYIFCCINRLFYLRMLYLTFERKNSFTEVAFKENLYPCFKFFILFFFIYFNLITNMIRKNHNKQKYHVHSFEMKYKKEKLHTHVCVSDPCLREHFKSINV